MLGKSFYIQINVTRVLKTGLFSLCTHIYCLLVIITGTVLLNNQYRIIIAGDTPG